MVRNDDLDLDLGQEVDGVLAAPVELGVALLASEAAHLGHGHADHPDRGERFLDVVELERLDDGLDLFHHGPSRARQAKQPPCRAGPGQGVENQRIPRFARPGEPRLSAYEICKGGETACVSGDGRLTAGAGGYRACASSNRGSGAAARAGPRPPACSTWWLPAPSGWTRARSLRASRPAPLTARP